MHRRRDRLEWIAAAAALLLTACGGSGSTGLISAETALLAEVRESGRCLDANGTTYCLATQAESVDVGAPTDPPNNPEPCLDAECPPAAATPFTFDTADLPVDTTCAVAAREHGEAWSIGEAAEVGDGSSAFQAPPTFASESGSSEAALLCFDIPPEHGTFPATLEVLADAEPSIILVAPNP